MERFTTEEVEDMVRTAVGKTEKSFGGTFKRMKAENEDLRAGLDAARTEFEAERAAFAEKLAEAVRDLAGAREEAGRYAVREEVRRQLAGRDPLPERFVPVAEIPYTGDPEELAEAVAAAIEKGRTEFGETLREAGIPPAPETAPAVNPTNPAVRNAGTARDLKSAAARDALRDMTRRGLLR